MFGKCSGRDEAQANREGEGPCLRAGQKLLDSRLGSFLCLW